MKIVFLDIDGVMNNFTSRNFKDVFSDKSCENLNHILRELPEVQLVLSSSWRYKGLEYVKEVFHKNGIDKSRLVDMTEKGNGLRGVQIQDWLDKHKEVEHFVAIDDETQDMGNLANHVIKVNGFIGLTMKEVTQAIQHLKDKK